MENFTLSVQRFDEFADEYARRFMDMHAYADSMNEFFNLIPSQNPCILELACGPGNVTRLMAERFTQSKIVALDLAPNMIAIARKHLPQVDFRIMDVRDIVSISQKFDAVMCSFCLPFLSKKDASRLIADCAVLLESKGVIYISTMEGEESKAGFEPTSFSGQSTVYFNYHRQQDIENALTEAGFENCHVKLQDYAEPDGSVTTDMIFIARKG